MNSCDGLIHRQRSDCKNNPSTVKMISSENRKHLWIFRDMHMLTPKLVLSRDITLVSAKIKILVTD